MIKRAGVLAVALLLVGCASSPYAEVKFSYQIDRMSDWVLQPDRPWICTEGTCDQEMRTWIQVGTEWSNQTSLFFETNVGGQYDHTFFGLSRKFGAREYSGFFVQPELRHQVDGMTERFLRTDQKQWQGHNPFVHLRVGYQINPAFFAQIATGKSLFQGAPFESEDGAPDLYWTRVEAGFRLWGKRGLFSEEHLER